MKLRSCSNKKIEWDDDSKIDHPALVAAEWKRELSDDLGRHRRLVLVIARQLVCRHPEGAEQDVPERKRSGEIGVATGFQRRVVPAMEHRRRQHIFERSERP